MSKFNVGDLIPFSDYSNLYQQLNNNATHFFIINIDNPKSIHCVCIPSLVSRTFSTTSLMAANANPYPSGCSSLDEFIINYPEYFI